MGGCIGDGTWGLPAGGPVGGGPEGGGPEGGAEQSYDLNSLYYITILVLIFKYITQRQVSRFGLGTGHRSRGSGMGVWDGPRGPGMHFWDRSGCSRVRGRRWARLWGHTDHPGSRRDILEDKEGI